METYNKLKSVPAEMLKKIEGGRLKGMSDIKPQWRIQKLTEVFGLCGFGWKFEITNKWIEKGEKQESVAFVDLNLYVKVNDIWSDAIYGNGGSMFVTAEKNGLYTSDEAFKMAVTDALGTAAKHIGLAADIYMGHGGKYEQPPTQPEPPKQSKQKEKPQLTPEEIAALKKRVEDFETAIELCDTIEQVDANVLDAPDLMTYGKIKELVNKKKELLKTK